MFYSTSILASLFLYRNARKGNDVVINNMKFPLWSEGLSRHQTSHFYLLAIRIVLIAIPVYLETTLDSRDDPEMVSKTVAHAFVPQPVDDWFTYQLRSGEHIDSLRRTGLNAFFACTFVDEKGWVWAKVANVTYIHEHDVHQIRCVSSTEQPIYSLTEATVKYGLENEQYLKMNVSWTEGRVADFHQALVLKGKFGREALPNETAFRIHNLVALNDTAVECHVPLTVLTRFSKPWRGWCQKEGPIGVAFYSLRVDMDQFPMHNLSYEPRDRGLCGNSCKFRIRNATAVVKIIYRGSFEFKDKILLGAKHMANYVPDYGSSLRASDIARSILYSKASNVTVVTSSGRTLPRTEIEERAIIITISEIVVVLLFALMLS